MTVTCGQCGRGVRVPASGRRVGLCACGCAVAPAGTPMSEVRAALADAGLEPLPASWADQMREWAARSGVTPIARVQDAARAAFIVDAAREAFYASWSAYDAALQVMPAAQQHLQAKAEVYELTRMAEL